jgi:hypothetical protein
MFEIRLVKAEEIEHGTEKTVSKTYLRLHTLTLTDEELAKAIFIEWKREINRAEADAGMSLVGNSLEWEDLEEEAKEFYLNCGRGMIKFLEAKK